MMGTGSSDAYLTWMQEQDRQELEQIEREQEVQAMLERTTMHDNQGVSDEVGR